MKIFMKTLAAGSLLAGLAAGMAQAEAADDALVVNEEIEIVTRAPLPAHLEDSALTEVLSGWLFRDQDTRDMQRDDFENPGIPGVEAAREAFDMVDGSEGKACKDCHEAPEKLAGVRAVTPKVVNGKLMTMEDLVNDCRTNRMGAEAWGYNSEEIVNMNALLSFVSRGMPVNVAIDGEAAPFWEQGKEMYYTRYGQLELSCANCHENNYGNMIRADHLSQGQINAFPAYRLKTASLNGVHNRFKGCIRDTRAETFGVGSDEFRALELYVASRGNGLSVEGPSVRN